MVADLPVILWCRSPRLAQLPEFREIARVANRVVLDTAGAASATDAIWRLADSIRRGMVIADLAWTRLTRWRETLARVFENRDTLARLPEIRSVHVNYGAGYETAAWYFAAWVVNALDGAGVKALASITPASVTPGAPTLRLELTGAGLRVTLSREEDRLVTTIDDQSNCTNLPEVSDHLVMREELGILGRDAVFERTLASAARLAVSSSQ